MNDAILILNAGSSSIKFSLFAEQAAGLAVAARGQIESLYGAAHFIAKDDAGQTISEKTWEGNAKLGHEGALTHLIAWLENTYGSTYRLTAVGHRVVHGGAEYTAPTRVTTKLLAKLEALIPLAPLHQPHNLAPMHVLLKRMPRLPQIACFDTAFHSSNPQLAQMFALPYEFFDAGVRRYGFHGISYEYIASVLPQVDARAANGKTIVLHLGNGASMCALSAGRSIASTMSFTPLDGLPMGTRCGAIDPGVLLYLMKERKMDATAIEKLLYHESGLLGVSGVASDMRTLLQSDQPRAQLAVDLFIYRISRELGSLAAALGGLDAIVFTGGIGEHAVTIRERICRQAAWLGIDLNPIANEAKQTKAQVRISSAISSTSAWVIATDEELMIARHTRDLLTNN